MKLKKFFYKKINSTNDIAVKKIKKIVLKAPITPPIFIIKYIFTY